MMEKVADTVNRISEALDRGLMDDASLTVFREHFSHAEITKDLFLPKRICVRPIWNGVDRPTGMAISLDENETTLAERIQRAMESGRAFCSLERSCDVNGKTYISSTVTLSMASLDQDLKRLGF